MNKKQLAATIWKSANEMRSKIEANEYKDYILGFIFYKYLSEKEMRFFVKRWTSLMKILLIIQKTLLGTLSPMKIFFLHGLIRVMILMCLMFGSLCLHSID